MSTPRRGTNVVLATLFIGVFIMGCAELLVVGVLDLIAADVNVSVPAAGALVTAYALGLAIGGPILTMVTIRLDRRTVLLGSIVVFALANLVLVLASDHTLFIAARFVDGAVNGLFIGVAFMTAMSIVPEERQGRAISIVISGFTVSAALGVPLGTLLGQAVGWRNSFTVIIVLSVIALIATALFVPSTSNDAEDTSTVGQAKHAFAPRVLAVLCLNFLVFASLYAALTYIVPFLQEVTGVTGTVISVFLFAYGIANAVGSLGGGRFADKNATGTLIIGSIGAAGALLALFLTGPSPVLVVIMMLALGLFSMGMIPALQLRTVSLAGPGGQLASSLPASAANLGIAVGSVAGGFAITDFGASAPVITGLIIAVIGIGVAWATRGLRPPATEKTEESSSNELETAAHG